MELKSKLAVGAVGVLAVVGIGGGAAYASARSGSAVVTNVKAATPAAVDPLGGPDVQQGDPNGPDLSSTTPDTPEPPGAAETEAASDGPGGHADGPGDVQGQL